MFCFVRLSRCANRSLLVPCGVLDNGAMSADGRSYAINALQLSQVLGIGLECVAKAVFVAHGGGVSAK